MRVAASAIQIAADMWIGVTVSIGTAGCPCTATRPTS